MHHSSTDAGSSLSIHARPKYHLRNGLKYLHWSGQFLTDHESEAWWDVRERGVACIRKFPAAKGCKLMGRMTVVKPVTEDA